MQVDAYGVTRTTGCVARSAEHVVDLAAALGDPVFAEPALNAFMAQGPEAWWRAWERLGELEPRDEWLAPLHEAEAELVLPWRPGDYVDFYASESHATNLGRMFRPDAEPLLPNWRHLPVGYHGRAATIIVSGEPVYRPWGLTLCPGDDRPARRPSTMLDVEVELGVLVGVGSERGHPVPVERAWEHLFGYVLVNDWSARDIQAFEYQPLGPHLGKSFATSVSAWVLPAHAVPLVDGPPQDVDPWLRVDGPRVPDLDLTLELNGHVVSRMNARELTWGPAQLLAHATGNGAATRTGDLYASGTISGWAPGTYGSLIELTWRGEHPLELPDGTTRTFLEDGDVATIRAGDRLEVTGRVLPRP